MVAKENRELIDDPPRRIKGGSEKSEIRAGRPAQRTGPFWHNAVTAHRTDDRLPTNWDVRGRERNVRFTSIVLKNSNFRINHNSGGR